MSARYIDVQAFLAGTLEAPQTGAGGRRNDGVPLLYSAAVNVLLGDPECGKTLCAAAMAADELWAGGAVLWLDLDHNGAAATLSRFRQFGIDADTLADASRFRLAMPDDAEDVTAIVADAASWKPTLGVIDSMGELLPMFGANSNDSDDFTWVNRQVMAALALTGSAVLVIDHLAKNSQSREFGGTGTAAKKRAVDGAFFRVSLVEPFTPGVGGASSLSIVKDRHGYLRGIAGSGREPEIAMFRLTSGTATNWVFSVPQSRSSPVQNDLDRLVTLTPPPHSVRDIKTRLKWGTEKASKAWKAYQERSRNVPGRSGDGDGESCSSVPTPVGGNGERAIGNIYLEGAA